MSQDYYNILGVPQDASAQDIKRAFRQIARECHPDVAAHDPRAAERFKTARKAYETLMDPVTRARYDRRGARGSYPRGSFFDAFYKNIAKDRPPEKPRTYGAHDMGGHRSGRRAKRDAGNDLDLDDLFRDFGDFGFSGGASRRTRTGQSTSRQSQGPPQPTAGADVHIELEVPAKISAEGGSVTAVYYRMQRADSWRPGAKDAGVVRIQDLADIRIIPGTKDAEVLQERGHGDAGGNGGAYGDLIIRVRIVGSVHDAAATARGPHRAAVRQEAPPPPEPPPSEAPADPEDDEHAPTREVHPPAQDPDDLVFDISVVEAMLGGRVSLKTPMGKVRLTIPPGTSSGARMRLRGKGEPAANGDATDLYVLVRIVVPRNLDEESRALIERFAELNSESPRDDD